MTLRPEAARLLADLDTGDKHLIGDRLVNCLACADSGAVVKVDAPDPVWSNTAYTVHLSQISQIRTTVVPCPYCDAGQRRAGAEAAIETYDCSHDWQQIHTPAQPGLFACTLCGVHARLGLQRLPDPGSYIPDPTGLDED